MEYKNVQIGKTVHQIKMKHLIQMCRSLPHKHTVCPLQNQNPQNFMEPEGNNTFL